MASHIEVKIGNVVYRHTFTESDAIVAAALERFAKSMEPPYPQDGTNLEKLVDAVKKIIKGVSRISERVRLEELKDQQAVDLEAQAQQEAGLVHP